METWFRAVVAAAVIALSVPTVAAAHEPTFTGQVRICRYADGEAHATQGRCPTTSTEAEAIETARGDDDGHTPPVSAVSGSATVESTHVVTAEAATAGDETPTVSMPRQRDRSPESSIMVRRQAYEQLVAAVGSELALQAASSLDHATLVAAMDAADGARTVLLDRLAVVTVLRGVAVL